MTVIDLLTTMSLIVVWLPVGFLAQEVASRGEGRRLSPCVRWLLMGPVVALGIWIWAAYVPSWLARRLEG